MWECGRGEEIILKFLSVPFSHPFWKLFLRHFLALSFCQHYDHKCLRKATFRLLERRRNTNNSVETSAPFLSSLNPSSVDFNPSPLQGSSFRCSSPAPLHHHKHGPYNTTPLYYYIINLFIDICLPSTLQRWQYCTVLFIQ